MVPITGKIIEVFPSIQGEGIFVGQPQILIRLAGCNLKCDYCDTDFQKGTYLTKEELINQISKVRYPRLRRGFLLRQGFGGQVGGQAKSDVNHKSAIINHKSLYHSVSLTGGEPLLQVDFLRELIPKIKELGLKIYLETNGTLPENLAKVVCMVDYISMDIKLRSACNKSYWGHYKKSLSLITKHLPDSSFVKIVLTNKTTYDEIRKSISLIKNVSTRLPLVLQPVTPIRNIRLPAKEKIFAWQQEALRNLNNVRVIPQVHKLLKIK